MLQKIIRFSIRQKLIVGLFTLALVGYGIYQATQLPIDAVPDITNNQVQIITVAPSFGATDIERLVTFPIEQAVSNISGTIELRSFSRFGLSLVTIVFDDATDVYWARQQVAERLQQVQTQIPPDIGTPKLGPVTTGLGEIYQYVVKPKKGYEHKFDAIQLRTIQDWIVRRQLLGVQGVAEVSSFGGKLKQYEIAVDPNRLNAYGITIHDVFAAIEKNNQNTGGAYIEKGATVLYIRSQGLIGNANDINSIAIPNKNIGVPLFLRDVAEVKIGYATRYGAICYNDEGEVSGAVVMMLKGANSSDVIKRVKSRIVQIQKTLPEGVEIEPFLDRTKMVNNAISTVETNLLEGALIVVFVLVLFLGNFRAGIIVASVIPLAMLFAICMMNAFGVSGNLMSLGALDFGLIVDGAVIIVEAVMHQLAKNRGSKSNGLLNTAQMDAEVNGAAGKMMSSAVFGQVIILIVYLPIFALQGIEGKMFKPMAQTVVFALLGAFILSLTYIPMMSALFLSKKVNLRKNISERIIGRLERAYQAALSKVLRFPKLVFSAVLVLLVSAAMVMNALGGEFIPALEEGDFAVDTRVLTGSNLNTTIRSTQQAAGILKRQFPEVIKVVTKIGSGEVPTDPMPMEASDMMVILKDKHEWTSASSFDELAEKMGAALEDVPGITAGFQYPVQMRFNELMTGARQDVVCKIFGENLDTLAAAAAQLAKVISSVKGVQDLFVEPVTGMPQIVIEYNRALIAQHHLTIADVNTVVNTAFAGQSAGAIFEGEQRFDLVVRLADVSRKNMADVSNLLIPTPNGLQIPLHQLATVSVKDGPNQIQREDAKRRIVVGFNVNGRDVQTIVNEVQAKTDRNITFPAGYFVTYGGDFENLMHAKKRLMIAVPVCLLLIFLLLYFAFGSIKQSLLVYTAVPLSAIGGVFFLAIRGMPFSISAAIGFIALFGVAVLNGIVLIAEFNRLKMQGLSNIGMIVVKGSAKRLRPVLMTAFVASFGFLPMALSTGAGAEVQRPLATVVIGGLLVATFLTLFVLPQLYFLSHKKSLRAHTRKGKVALVLVCCLCCSAVFAQQKISLQHAIDLALQNNGQIKNEQLKAAYLKAKINTAFEVPKAYATGEYGQLNSALADSRFGLLQTTSLPGVYKSRRQLFAEEYNTALVSAVLTQRDVRRAVTQAFYEAVFLAEKQRVLMQADSLYANFYAKASLRLQKGETNLLEKTTAEAQRANIFVQLRQLGQATDAALLDLQWLLNAPQKCYPDSAVFKIEPPLLPDSSNLGQNATVKLLQQQALVAKAQTSVEKAKLLPELSMAYLNNSFVGMGADNKEYNASRRFSSLQVGVGFPIFKKGLKASVAASEMQEAVANSSVQVQMASLKNEYQKLLSLYAANKQIVSYFETTGLANAGIITQTANKQFLNGEINYLDFVVLINQALAIQQKYIDAVKNLNDSIIALNFITAP
ncbi:MAG: CusA/CzcA family heavy metal efflux RND transporter [Bacteroidetes bacterium]|nr:MAG: CusA/CzcA family heavy metal efflux RND transporter [Bacteroidota bacterium]